MSSLDSVFWISFVTIISGCILKLASLCFKSKCKECTVCGGRIKIIRDIEGEQRATEFELTHPPSRASPALLDEDPQMRI